MAGFETGEGTQKTIHFGNPHVLDYTQHMNVKRREQYLRKAWSRKANVTALSRAALSRYILWGNHTSIRANLAVYRGVYQV